jgi:hypothetical protein
MLVSSRLRSLGLVRLPGPPKSMAQLNRPARHCPLAKSAFCRRVLALSNEIISPC